MSDLPRNMFCDPHSGVYKVRKMVDGRRKKITLGTKDFKKALREYYKVQNAIEGGEWDGDDVPTFEQWWADYQKSYEVKKATRTQVRDGQMIEHGLKAFKGMLLTQVKKRHCQLYINQRLAAGAAPATVDRERGLLQAIFARAFEDDLIKRNPWHGIEREGGEARDRVLTWEEQEKVFAVATPLYTRWHKFMLGTGLRLDEAIKFTPDHFDRVKRLITVIGKGSKERQVPVSEEVEEIIDEQLEETPGRLWHATQWRYRDICGRYAERAGIPHYSPHTLRHTYGTRWIERGGDLVTLAEIMGHESIETTKRNYVHVSKEHLVSAAKRIDVLTPPKRGKVVKFGRGDRI
jgi:site-specific recombinase XerD